MKIGRPGSTHPWAPFEAISDTRFRLQCSATMLDNAFHSNAAQPNLLFSCILEKWKAEECIFVKCSAVVCSAVQEWPREVRTSQPLPPLQRQLLYNLRHPKVANLNIILIQNISCTIPYQTQLKTILTKFSLTHYHFKHSNKLLLKNYTIVAKKIKQIQTKHLI